MWIYTLSHGHFVSGAPGQTSIKQHIETNIGQPHGLSLSKGAAGRCNELFHDMAISIHASHNKGSS